MNAKDKEMRLKFKKMADDLRKAESWCDLDGVLNRIKTMQNLYEMGYRKQSEGEWIERIKETTNAKGFTVSYHINFCSECGYEIGIIRYKHKYCPNCGAKMKGGAE